MIWVAIISGYIVCWFVWICWELRQAYTPSDELQASFSSVQFHKEDEHWLISHQFIV